MACPSRVAASSRPASLVAKTAELQAPDLADRVLRRLRETVFALGEPAVPDLAKSRDYNSKGDQISFSAALHGRTPRLAAVG